jgi:hypothetical protein
MLRCAHKSKFKTTQSVFQYGTRMYYFNEKTSTSLKGDGSVGAVGYINQVNKLGEDAMHVCR